MSHRLPWVLLVLVSGAWAATSLWGTADRSPSTEGAPAGESRTGTPAHQAEVEALRARIRELESAQDEPLLTGRPESEPVSRPTATVNPEADPRGEAEAQAKQRHAHRAAIHAQVRAWNEQIRSVRDAQGRERALDEIQEALGGEDPIRLQAALDVSRWLGGRPADPAAWRGAIEPHVESVDPSVRVSALLALAAIDPSRADMAAWSDAVLHASRSTAEAIAGAIVRSVGGELDAASSAALLHLLRDGAPFHRSGVIRALQGVTRWTPDLEARILEILRTSKDTGNEVHYVHHFLTPRWKDKSDALVDAILDALDAGRGRADTVVRGLRVGLDADQQARAADRLLDLVGRADQVHVIRALAEALETIATAGHEPRLAALASNEDLAPAAREILERTRRRVARR